MEHNLWVWFRQNCLPSCRRQCYAMREFLQRSGDSIGFWKVDRSLRNTSFTTQNAKDGERSLEFLRWQTYHQLIFVSSLHLLFSTVIDCFGPYIAKIGRRNEKSWAVIFKCLTTRVIHLDLLNSMDMDDFFIALRQFIAWRGKPAEIISDRGTHFRGADRELQSFWGIGTTASTPTGKLSDWVQVQSP